MSQQLRIGKKLDWKRIGKFSDIALETHLRNDPFRTVQKSGKQNQICNECTPNEDQHFMAISYRKCSSVKCNSEVPDSGFCPYRYIYKNCSF
jgi:hypothetical protein